MPSLATLQSPGTWHLITLSLTTGTTFFHRSLTFQNSVLILVSSVELFNTRSLLVTYISLFQHLLLLASPSNSIRIPPIKNLPNLFLPPKYFSCNPLLYIAHWFPPGNLDHLIRWINRKLSRGRTMDNQVPYSEGIFWSDGSLMNVRHRLEKTSGTKYSDDNISPEMKSLNKKFGIAHGN